MPKLMCLWHGGMICQIVMSKYPTRHHSAEQGREAPGECLVTPFGPDIGPVTCRGVTVFVQNEHIPGLPKNTVF